MKTARPRRRFGSESRGNPEVGGKAVDNPLTSGIVQKSQSGSRARRRDRGALAPAYRAAEFKQPWPPRRQFENVTLLKETRSEMRGIRFIETLAQDMRYGLWMLRGNPLTESLMLASLGAIGGVLIAYAGTAAIGR